MDDETRTAYGTTFELNKLAQTLRAVREDPGRHAGAHSEHVMSIAERIRAGSVSDLSPERIAEIGQDVVNGLSEKEIRHSQITF